MSSQDEGRFRNGLGRIARQNTAGTDYFLGDALESVRQLTKAVGGVAGRLVEKQYFLKGNRKAIGLLTMVNLWQT